VVSAGGAGLGLVVLLILLPRVLGAREQISPRVAAGGHLVALIGWALLPALWLACLGGAIGSWIAGTRLSGGCLFGLNRGQWQLLGYLPAAAALGVLVWHAIRRAVAAQAAQLRGLALAASARQQVQGGPVWVVPSTQPAAYAGGLWRPKAVVTSGLLAPLDPRERAAVCEHEVAHVRLGHPRVCWAGGAVASAYGVLPPVRQAWDGLRRELEAAADDEAVSAVGAAPVLSALVRTALKASGIADALVGFNHPEHLRYRIARLEGLRPSRRAPTAVAGSAVGMLSLMMAWTLCVLAGAHASEIGVVACLVAIGALGLRPMWARGYRKARP
jgi:hypothetical protein